MDGMCFGAVTAVAFVFAEFTEGIILFGLEEFRLVLGATCLVGVEVVLVRFAADTDSLAGLADDVIPPECLVLVPLILSETPMAELGFSVVLRLFS